MACTTITDAYNEFSDMHGDQLPIRTEEELRQLIHAADLRYEDIDERFWDLAFGDAHSGLTSWAFDPIDTPTDAQWLVFRSGGE